jgi:hypothetical protein
MPDAKRPRRRRGTPATAASRIADAEREPVILEPNADGRGWHRVDVDRIEALESRVAALESRGGAPPASGTTRIEAPPPPTSTDRGWRPLPDTQRRDTGVKVKGGVQSHLEVASDGAVRAVVMGLPAKEHSADEVVQLASGETRSGQLAASKERDALVFAIVGDDVEPAPKVTPNLVRQTGPALRSDLVSAARELGGRAFDLHQASPATSATVAEARAVAKANWCRQVDDGALRVDDVDTLLEAFDAGARPGTRRVPAWAVDGMEVDTSGMNGGSYAEIPPSSPYETRTGTLHHRGDWWFVNCKMRLPKGQKGGIPYSREVMLRAFDGVGPPKK